MSQRPKTCIAVFLIVAFACLAVFLTLHPSLTGGSAMMRFSMDEDLSDGWTTADGSPVDLSSLDDLPDFPEHSVTIRRQLPDAIEPGTELSFMTDNLMFHLYYGDEEVYAFTPDVTLFGTPYASSFHFAPLSPANAGMTIQFEIECAYADSSSSIRQIRACDTTVYVQRYVRENGFAFVASLLVMFVGLAVLFLYASIGHTEAVTLDLFSLGIVTILLGIWSEAQTLVVQLTTGQAGLARALEYLSLLFAPYPLVVFVGSLVESPHRKRCQQVALVATLITIGIVGVGTAVLGIDMHYLLTSIHVLMALAAALTVYQIVARARVVGHDDTQKVLAENRLVIVGFLVFITCGLIDFYRFIASNRGVSDPALFLRCGLLFFVIILAQRAFRLAVAYVTRANRADVIEMMAYTDTLTGIGNRSAWHNMCTAVSESLHDGGDALACAFDVNFLKRVNDTYGHAAGDAHIQRAADTINRSFGVEGSCFRTGGDEFCALIVGENLMERYEMCRGLLETSLAEQCAAAEGEEPLSLAVGCALVSETAERTLDAAQELADQRMYAHKRSMKAERTD